MTLKIKYENKTEYRVMETTWAANMVADKIMRLDEKVQQIDLLNDNGTLNVTYRRREENA